VSVLAFFRGVDVESGTPRVSERRRDRPGVFILSERVGDSPRPLVRRILGEAGGAVAGAGTATGLILVILQVSGCLTSCGTLLNVLCTGIVQCHEWWQIRHRGLIWFC